MAVRQQDMVSTRETTRVMKLRARQHVAMLLRPEDPEQRRDRLPVV